MLIPQFSLGTGGTPCPCPDPSPRVWRPRDAARCTHPAKWRGSHDEMRCASCNRCLDHGRLPIPPRSMATIGGVTVANHTDRAIPTGDDLALIERVMWTDEARS